MSTLSQLTLVHGDAKAAAALSFAFEREGTKVSLAQSKDSLLSAIKDGCQLVITGATDKNEASSQLAMIQEAAESVERRIPILYFGNAISRDQAMKEGANEFLGQPAYLRDVITLGKLMATPMERRTQSISGELSEHFGLFYFVRALGTIQYNGVLTLLRGLRRGELRFYNGQATSAQLGGLHGLSALHQMLLWTNARFDLREEEVVHRRQIPLSHAEVLQDCERFLSEIRAIAGPLSPSAVLAVDPSKDISGLPKPVQEVLRLFNGTSSVADAIEDSPFQNFETLRIACRLIEQEIVTQANNQAPIQLSTTALSIDEWLVSGQIRSSESTKVGAVEEGSRGKPVSPPVKGKSKNLKRRRKNRLTDPKSSEVKERVERNEKSWSDVLPSQENMEELAPVVPATAAVGEINVFSPSSRVTKEISDPKVPTRERMEEHGAGSLCNIFVDEGLKEEKPPKNGEMFSWEEKTAPAKQLGIVDDLDGEDHAEGDDSQLPVVGPIDPPEDGLFEAKVVPVLTKSASEQTAVAGNAKTGEHVSSAQAPGDKSAAPDAKTGEHVSSAQAPGDKSAAPDAKTGKHVSSAQALGDKSAAPDAKTGKHVSSAQAPGDKSAAPDAETGKHVSSAQAPGDKSAAADAKTGKHVSSAGEKSDVVERSAKPESPDENLDEGWGESLDNESDTTSEKSSEEDSGAIAAKSTPDESSDKDSDAVAVNATSDQSSNKASGEIAAKSVSESSDKDTKNDSDKNSDGVVVNAASDESSNKASGEIAAKPASKDVTKGRNDMYQPKEVALAHKLVSAAAADGVFAYRAAKEANALVRKSKAVRNGAPANTISDDASTRVEEVAAAAESAAAQVMDFSAEEEAFFSRGLEEAKIVPPPVDNFEDLDDDYEIPKTFWGRFMRDPTKDNRKKKG